MGTGILRQGSIGVVGASVTLLLFVFMAKLIQQPPGKPATPSDPPVINVTAPERVLTPPARPVPPTPVTTRVIPSRVIAPSEGGEETGILDPGQPESTRVVLEGPAQGGADSRDLMPLVQISPAYPIEAAQAGKEGYVVVGFDIDINGNTANVQVLDANPKRTFDTAARNAVKKWKYRPKLIGGKPMAVTNQQVRLDFNLDQQR